MKPKIILEQNLRSWIDNMAKRYPVHAPVPHNGDYDYKPITHSSEIAFGFDRTRMSGKHLFFKPEERLMEASRTQGNAHSVELETDQQIIFGLRPCDITALNLFDKVFSGDYYDPYYFAQRERNIVIGLRCRDECRTCFCGTMNSYNPLNGFDIMLTELSAGKYVVELGTEKGKQLVRQDAHLMHDITAAESRLAREVYDDIEETFHPHVSLVGVRALMDAQLPDELLKKYEDICLSCGQCTFVCPTCWCFKVSEVVGADPEDFGNIDKTARVRTWTSCLYKNFHTVSGAPPHVFKPKSGSRLEAYYDHKLKGITQKFGEFGCVGCGRCFQSCPVGIDIRETLSVLTGMEGI